MASLKTKNIIVLYDTVQRYSYKQYAAVDFRFILWQIFPFSTILTVVF